MNRALVTHAAHSGSGISAGALAAAIVAAVVVLACAAWLVVRMRGREPHWVLTARHAVAEAGYRTSSTWAEFTDWLRLGR